MIFRWHSIAALLLPASTAFAGWYGFPCPSNVSWYSLETNHYVSQLYSGIVERCDAIGAVRPSVVDTYSNLFAGYTNTYSFFTNIVCGTNGCETNFYTITNNWIVYTNVTVTNQFLPFTYSWSQTNGTSGTATCYPSIKRSWFTTWDSKLFAICPSYINADRLGTNTNWDAWFLSPGNISNTAASFPKFASTSLLESAGVGWTNRTAAHWTRSILTSDSDWLLASIHSSGTNPAAWTFKRWTDLTNSHPADAMYCPIAQYIAGGTNIPTNITFSLSGTAWGANGSNSISVSESATFTSTNDVPLTNSWKTITGITCSSERPNLNDAIRITYKTLPSLYDASMGWVLTAASINERKACIDKLLWTDTSGSYGIACTNVRMGVGVDEATAESAWPTNTTAYDYAAVRVGSWKWKYDRIGERDARISLADWTITNAPPSNAAFAATCEYYTCPLVLNWRNPRISAYVFKDVGGHGFLLQTYSLVGTSSEAFGGRIMTETLEYDTTIPEWCPEYEGGSFNISYATSLGYEITGAKIVYKWDGTNGFKYK